jgi:hypothetical protein
MGKLDWLRSRQRGVGSSDSPILAGLGYKKTALDLYYDKILPVREDHGENPDFRRGHAYEPFAVRLFEMQRGIKCHMPETEDERWQGFQVWHPFQAEQLFTDLDGWCEDGWLLEIKAPRQAGFGRVQRDGPSDGYLIQCQQHIMVANAARFMGREWNGCHLVTYAPETVEILIHDVLPDLESQIQITENAMRFMEHVTSRIPPSDWAGAPVPVVKPPKEYTPVDGPEWAAAIRDYQVATEMLANAERRQKATKEALRTSMRSAGHVKIQTPGGNRLSLTMQKGRKAFDERALMAAHPEIDLDQYKREGNPFEVFRIYGPKDDSSLARGDESLEGRLVTLVEEFDSLAGRNVPDEIAMGLLDELRNRSEVYERFLGNELQAIENAKTKAIETIVQKVKEGENHGDATE